MLSRRSDLATEARRIWSEDNVGQIEGVEETVEERSGFQVTTVDITSEGAAKELGKAVGKYVTVELGRFLRREDEAFEDCVRVLADIIAGLTEKAGGGALVVGLGNPAITPDAVGHLVVKNTLVTRHLRQQMPDAFAAFGDVAALEPGVLGTTGVESVDVVGAIAEKIRPGVVIAVDALASRSMDRVCRTVQISDTGIVPGSGVGNARGELSQRALGVPVGALGVPAVVDAATLTLDMAREAGVELDAAALRERSGKMIVTPREIDSAVADISRLMGYAIDVALNPGLQVRDVDMFLG